MIVDISNKQQTDSAGGTDGPGQLSTAVQLVRNVVKTCKAMSSYESASAMLLQLFEVVSADPAAFAELRRGIEEVRAFFERRNTPQPSAQYEGCNFYTGGTQIDKYVGSQTDIGTNYGPNIEQNGGTLSLQEHGGVAGQGLVNMNE